MEREKIEKLIEKVDELLVVLNSVSEDLRTISTSLKSIAISQMAPPSPPSPVISAPKTTEIEKVEISDVKNIFPEDLGVLLTFEDRGDFIMIKPRQFLGSENFARIAAIVREAGGEYISAGKESHFRVPKKRI
jgi:hypothetical protein